MNTKTLYTNFLLAAGFMLILSACNPSSTERFQVMTVRGPVRADSMGITLAHEHILVDFVGADSTGYHRWNRDTVAAIVLPWLHEAKNLGVGTMIECTPAYLGRDPVLLKSLSEKTGLQIITNTGIYGATENKAIPAYAWQETADQLAARWVLEYTNGIENTGIRPGFIKIAVPGDSVLSPIHEKLVRAAARTHLATGLTITAHTGPAATALAEIAILKEEGVDPSAFVWTHAQHATPGEHLLLAHMGAWVSLDNVMESNVDEYLGFLLNLKAYGLLNRVLISHDAGWYDVINPHSVAYRGYSAIFTHLWPKLKANGFSEPELDMLLTDNPREAYLIRVRHT